jgi:hypothetical protein
MGHKLMADPNPYAKWAPNPYEGFRPVGNPDPKKPIEIQSGLLGNTGKTIANTKDAATLPDDIATAHINRQSAALKFKGEQEAYNVSHGLMPDGTAIPGGGSNIHGAARLAQLPPEAGGIVSSLLQGDLPAGVRSLASKVALPYIKMAIDVDPTFSASNFETRNQFKKELISGKPGEGSMVQALNTALAHSYSMQGFIKDLHNNSGAMTLLNPLGNTISRAMGKKAATVFDAEASKYGNEQTAVYSPKSSGQGERQEQVKSLPRDGSPEQQYGVLKGDAQMMTGKIESINQQGKNALGPGFDIYKYLSPEAKMAIAHYKELDPEGIAADGKQKNGTYAAFSMGQPDGPGAGSTGGGGNTPSPTAPLGDEKTDSKMTALADQLIRAQTPHDAAMKIMATAGGTDAPFEASPKDWEHALQLAHDNPNYTGHFANATAPTTWQNRFLATPAGTAASNIVNTGMGGIPEWLGGEDTRLAMNANNAANPKSAIAGKTAGFVAGALGLGKVDKAVGVLKDAAKVAPIIDGAVEAVPGRLSQMGSYLRASSPDLVLGASNGASENPDHPILGAVEGTASVFGGSALGHAVLAPALRLAAETAPGKALASAAIRATQGFADARAGGAAVAPSTKAGILQAIAADGAGFTPAPALSKGDQLIAKSGALGPDALPGVQSQLRSAADLKMPMALADTDPRLRMLGGSASRLSPDVRALAETTLGERSAGRNARAMRIIDEHLAPTANVDGLKAEVAARAQAAADPHYAAAMEHPPVDDPKISELLNTTQGQAAAKQGYTNAESNGIPPGDLSMTIDPVTGQPRYDAQINWPTLQRIKFGMDANLEGMRNPLTQKLDTTPGSPADGLQALRRQFVARAGQLNGDFRQGNQVYGNIAREGSVAQQGYDLAKNAGRMNSDQVGTIAAGIPEQYAPHFRQGYASNLYDRVHNSEADPYGLLNGPEGAQQRLSAIFPDGAPRIDAANKIEDSFALTKQELTGGSPTQARAMGDKAFQAAALGLGGAADYMTMAHTGMPLGSMAGLAGLAAIRRAAAATDGRMTTAVADEVGPQLLRTDPLQNMTAINMLLKQNAARQAYLKQWGQAGGAVGGTALGGGQ